MINQTLPLVIASVSGQWQLTLSCGVKDRAELEAVLAERLQTLIDQQPAVLWQLLYRLDISESLACSAMGSVSPAAELATLLVDREIKRLAYRAKYSTFSPDNDPNTTP